MQSFSKHGSSFSPAVPWKTSPRKNFGSSCGIEKLPHGKRKLSPAARIGGAAVSTKHAGFVVNMGGALAADVKALLKQVSDQVFSATGIRLEPEVRIW